MKRCPICGATYSDDSRFCPADGGTLRVSGGAEGLVGQVIADRYHVLRKLGEGGMGEVYLAEHVKMGRQSAIKVISAGLASDPEAVSRFNREAANACRISHPNVCAIYDFGEHDGLIYLAMEYIEGRTLSAVLREGGPLPLPRAAAILAQCGDALQAAHDLGIVHRDLKPDNIMIASSKGRDVVKVVDFGIAKAVGGDDAQKVTKTGLVIGTPEYMSPEQILGEPPDGRSDIYSLGLVFYRMVAGRLPFEADSAPSTLLKRLTESPLPLAEICPDTTFGPALQPVLDRALERSAVKRYATASEFARDVSRVVDTLATVPLAAVPRTVPATRVAPASRLPAPPRRRSRLMVLLPVAAGGAAVLLAGALVLRQPASGRTAAPLQIVPAAAVPIGPDSTPARPLDTAPRPIRAVSTSRSEPAAPKLPQPAGADSDAATDSAVPARFVETVLDSLEHPDVRRRYRRKAQWVLAHPRRYDASRRADAAAVMALISLEKRDTAAAHTWIDRAMKLEPKPAYRSILTQLSH